MCLHHACVTMVPPVVPRAHISHTHIILPPALRFYCLSPPPTTRHSRRTAAHSPSLTRAATIPNVYRNVYRNKYSIEEPTRGVNVFLLSNHGCEICFHSCPWFTYGKFLLMKFSPEFVLTTPTLHFAVPSANDALPLGCTSPPSRPSSANAPAAASPSQSTSASATPSSTRPTAHARATAPGTPQRRVAGLAAASAPSSPHASTTTTSHHSQRQGQRART